MQRKLLLVLFLFVAIFNASAQDPQFSQFYAAPLYLNPAFAGSNQATRGIMNYRNQWPSIDAHFVTSMASFDHYFRKFNSGVGLVALMDKEGNGGGFQTYAVSAQYAYQLNLNKNLTLRPGLQGGYSNRSIRSDGLQFTDEFDDQGVYTKNEEFHNNQFNKASYFDVSSGAILYSENYWIGFSAHHLNSPKQKFLLSDSGNARIAPKFSLHAGYKIPLKVNEFPRRYLAGQKRGSLQTEREVSITPAINYKNQGPFHQLDAGLYFLYEPVTFGAWYRGIPIGNFNGIEAINHDAFIFLLGFQIMDLQIGYSYDLTISRLGTSTGGAHEISLVYDFYLGYRNQKKKNPPRNVRRMPCPKF